MAYPSVPHFSLPFVIGPDGSPTCVEQDTSEDVAQCVLSLMLTPVGSRVELPGYGVPEIVFREHVDRQSMVAAVEQWEPRAKVVFTDWPDPVDELMRTVVARVAVR